MYEIYCKEIDLFMCQKYYIDPKSTFKKIKLCYLLLLIVSTCLGWRQNLFLEKRFCLSSWFTQTTISTIGFVIRQTNMLPLGLYGSALYTICWSILQLHPLRKRLMVESSLKDVESQNITMFLAFPNIQSWKRWPRQKHMVWIMWSYSRRNCLLIKVIIYKINF